jgi:hypothetical protein
MEHSERVGEFALGTNTGVTQMIGNLLQDEKVPGVHILSLPAQEARVTLRPSRAVPWTSL